MVICCGGSGSLVPCLTMLTSSAYWAAADPRIKQYAAVMPNRVPLCVSSEWRALSSDDGVGDCRVFRIGLCRYVADFQATVTCWAAVAKVQTDFVASKGPAIESHAEDQDTAAAVATDDEVLELLDRSAPVVSSVEHPQRVAAVAAVPTVGKQPAESHASVVVTTRAEDHAAASKFCEGLVSHVQAALGGEVGSSEYQVPEELVEKVAVSLSNTPRSLRAARPIKELINEELMQELFSSVAKGVAAVRSTDVAEQPVKQQADEIKVGESECAVPPSVEERAVSEQLGRSPNTLYVHPLSGNALGAMLYVTERRLPIKLEFVDILKGEQMQPWYTALNPTNAVR